MSLWDAVPSATQSTPAETLSLLSKTDKMVYEFPVLHLVISRESTFPHRVINCPFDPDPSRLSY